MSIEVYPVVHVQDTPQTVEQASMAYELGANGVYLIDHNSYINTKPLIQSYATLASMYPDKFIGLNFLQFSNSYITFKYTNNLMARDEIPRLPDGLWTDNAGMVAEATNELRDKHPELRNVRYLGGVAFKYTLFYTGDPLEAAKQAHHFADYVDVVTTSGVGTGQAASIEKVSSMKQAIGEQRLALASGVDLDNIALFEGCVDEILVATSIETTPQSGIFNENKLRDLLAAAHQE